MINNQATLEYNYSAETTEQQAEKVLAILRDELTDSTNPWYLLVDPVPLFKSGGSPFLDRLIAEDPVPIRLPHSSLIDGDYPWLLPLDITKAANQDLLQQSVLMALQEIHPQKLCHKAGRAICGWLSSPFDLTQVTRQLGETTIQQRVVNSPILMRYYDPAIHNLLWTQLAPFWHKRLMGMLARWIFVDGDGQSVIRHHTPASHPQYTFQLALIAEQADFILHDCGIINRALRQYRQQAINHPRRCELACALLIQQALARLTNHPALANDAEKEIFALQVLQYHPEIDQHPKIEDLLDPDTFADNVPWSQRIKHLTPTQWQQYARDCDARQQRHITTENMR